MKVFWSNFALLIISKANIFKYLFSKRQSSLSVCYSKNVVVCGVYINCIECFIFFDSKDSLRNS